MVGQGEMKEAGSLDLTPVRPGGPIRHKVDSELSLRRLDSSVGGSSGYLSGREWSVLEEGGV